MCALFLPQPQAVLIYLKSNVYECKLLERFEFDKATIRLRMLSAHLFLTDFYNLTCDQEHSVLEKGHTTFCS